MLVTLNIIIIVVFPFVICNAWKYRSRAPYKGNTEDMRKADEYMLKAKQLKEKMRNE